MRRVRFLKERDALPEDPDACIGARAIVDSRATGEPTAIINPHRVHCRSVSRLQTAPLAIRESALRPGFQYVGLEMVFPMGFI
jgi:hypothetical protein